MQNMNNINTNNKIIINNVNNINNKNIMNVSFWQETQNGDRKYNYKYTYLLSLW